MLTPLAESVLIPLGLLGAASKADAGTGKTILGSGSHNPITYCSGTGTLIISNEEIDDVMKTVKSLRHSGLLIKDATKTIKLKQKNKKLDFLVYY